MTGNDKWSVLHKKGIKIYGLYKFINIMYMSVCVCQCQLWLRVKFREHSKCTLFTSSNQ